VVEAPQKVVLGGHLELAPEEAPLAARDLLKAQALQAQAHLEVAVVQDQADEDLQVQARQGRLELAVRVQE